MYHAPSRVQQKKREMNLVNPFDLAKEEPPKPTPFDYATTFIIPLLSLAAGIVSAVQQHPVAMGVLIGITAFSLILGFLPLPLRWPNTSLNDGAMSVMRGEPSRQ